MLLDVQELSKFFGGLHAVEDVSMSIEKGQIVGLIGPNGAGKTTIFNLLTGVFRKTTGTVTFDGRDITRKSPHKIASYGIARTFQLTPLFAEFTTLENVIASYYLNARSKFWDVLFSTPAYRKHETYALEQSMEILELVGLSKVKDEMARNLPHGYQKMLGIARALAVKPKLLLLDEPLGGLNADEIEFTVGIMRKLNEQGISILVIEHNMQIMDVCDKIVVINFGQKIADGTPDEVRNNPEVVKAYLGS